MWDVRSGLIDTITTLEDTLPWDVKYLPANKDIAIGCDSGELIVINI
jgi:hypothetical protein